jgi:hypothetical protein
MPPSLPEPLQTCNEGPYALAIEDYDQLRQQLEVFTSWAQSPLQPSRAGHAIADATVSNSVQAARTILGFAANVAHRDGTPTLKWLLDGELIASYISWGGSTRQKKPLSLSLELSCVVRILEFIGSGTLRLDETSRTELERLKAALRRLASQLSNCHKPVTSIPELEAAGRWADFTLVQEKVAAEAASVLRCAEDDAARTPQLARRVHDSLLSCLVTLDSAPNRPGCLRSLKMPDFAGTCECGDATCAGNRFDGTTMVLQHTKTSRSRDAIRVDFAGTVTADLLQNHVEWARDTLTSGDVDGGYIWLNSKGRPFASDESFSSYLPRVLARLDLPHLSFTTLRHSAIVAASDWATKEELEGLARSIGTSVRKCAEVYDYRAKERSAGRFLTEFRKRAGGSSPEETPPETPTTMGFGAPPPVLHELAQPPPPRGMIQRLLGLLGVAGGAQATVQPPKPAPAFARLEAEPVFPSVHATAFNAAPLLALPAVKHQAVKPRKAVRVDAGTSFADFLAARKRINVGGPGRCASPVQRALTRDQAEFALGAGVSAMRSAYAFAYGFECTSGNLNWLRRKIEEAVQGEEEEEEDE